MARELELNVRPIFPTPLLVFSIPGDRSDQCRIEAGGARAGGVGTGVPRPGSRRLVVLSRHVHDGLGRNNMKDLLTPVVEVATQATEYSDRAPDLMGCVLTGGWSKPGPTCSAKGAAMPRIPIREHFGPGSTMSRPAISRAAAAWAAISSCSIREDACRPCWRPICATRCPNCTTPATPSPSRRPQVNASCSRAGSTMPLPRTWAKLRASASPSIWIRFFRSRSYSSLLS